MRVSAEILAAGLLIAASCTIPRIDTTGYDGEVVECHSAIDVAGEPIVIATIGWQSGDLYEQNTQAYPFHSREANLLRRGGCVHVTPYGHDLAISACGR